MVNLQIRDVPEEIRDVLARSARESGQSLSMYLRDVVVREASFLDNRRLIDEMRSRPRTGGVSVEEALEALAVARESTSA